MSYKVKCSSCGKTIKTATATYCRSCSKKGHSVSIETRKKISNSLQGKCVNNKEHYEKLSKLMTGRKQSKEHNLAISKGLTGRKLSTETKEKLRKYFTKKWEDLSYTTKHINIRLLYGKADRCDSATCKRKSNKFEWSNISGKYLEDRTDWQRLCSICHYEYDRKVKVYV